MTAAVSVHLYLLKFVKDILVDVDKEICTAWLSVNNVLAMWT